jgi:hypothetical protein
MKHFKCEKKVQAIYIYLYQRWQNVQSTEIKSRSGKMCKCQDSISVVQNVQEEFNFKMCKKTNFCISWVKFKN